MANVVAIENFAPRNGGRKTVTFECFTKCHQRIASTKVTEWVVCMLPLATIPLLGRSVMKKKKV